MAAAIILGISVLALLQFAISQWRLIWLTTANQPLSDMVRTTAGIDENSIEANDFGTLLNLCDELSPAIRKDTPWLREVRCYYRIMSRVQNVCASALPGLGAWAACETKICARFVAVVLDQNLALDLDRRAATRAI